MYCFHAAHRFGVSVEDMLYIHQPHYNSIFHLANNSARHLLFGYLVLKVILESPEVVLSLLGFSQNITDLETKNYIIHKHVYKYIHTELAAFSITSLGILCTL